MSLCIAWVRKTGSGNQIVLAADSCFSGGQRFFAAPKLFALRRGDCAIACAGSTYYSFSIVEHIRHALDFSQPVADRAYDLSDIIHNIVEITNQTLLQNDKIWSADLDFQMILAGFSWKLKRPILGVISYNRKKKQMTYRSAMTIKKLPVAVIGDKEVVMPVRKRIFDVLEERGIPERGNFDMIPYDVLLEVIDDPKIDTIDGEPQVMKVFQHLKTMHYGIRMINAQGTYDIYFLGRKLLPYENFPYLIMDKYTKDVYSMKEVRKEYKRGPSNLQPIDNVQE